MIINEVKYFRQCFLSALGSFHLILLGTSCWPAVTECYQAGESHETKQNKNSILCRTKRKNARVYVECCKVSLFCPWINRKCLGSDRVFIAPISHPEDVH